MRRATPLRTVSVDPATGDITVFTRTRRTRDGMAVVFGMRRVEAVELRNALSQAIRVKTRGRR